MNLTVEPWLSRSKFVIILTRVIILILYCFTLPIYLINPEYSYHITRKIGVTIWINIYRFFGLQILQEGKFPDYQAILVSNHQHNFDTMLIPYFTKTPTTYITKQFSKIFTCLYDFIVVRGEDKVSTSQFIKRLKEECLTKKKSIVIFPEGTRVPINEKINFQTTPALMARYLKLPIVPISLNTGHVFKSHTSEFLDFSKPITITAHPKIYYEDVLFHSLFLEENTEKVATIRSMSIDQLKEIINYFHRCNINSIKLINQIKEKVSILSFIPNYKLNSRILEQTIIDILKDLNLSETLSLDTAKQILKDIGIAHQVLYKIIPEKDNKEKDLIVTNYLQKLINSSVVQF